MKSVNLRSDAAAVGDGTADVEGGEQLKSVVPPRDGAAAAVGDPTGQLGVCPVRMDLSGPRINGIGVGDAGGGRRGPTDLQIGQRDGR